MLSKGKQITLGIFTVIAFSVAATLAIGEVCIIDTIVFADVKPILLCAVYALYFAVLVIYAALAKRKNLESLAKTSIIFAAVISGVHIITMLALWISEIFAPLSSVFDALFAILGFVIYPLFILGESFIGSFDAPFTQVLGTVVLAAAPIVAGVIYFLTKKPTDTKAADEHLASKEE